ncbi:hypothetical protein VIBNISOn1_1050046 [Vibrio nigripulchritudo SOn1]|uniref:Transposase n=1 Tax=Vibrio nigripulchritudo SOn1 TaxID=1238450 RepID=A0AAV2VHU8_9VIBR|nr:hypothetical protein VIBNISOn1_1050046 [Vibrio nigripulchritudo SOn1]
MVVKSGNLSYIKRVRLYGRATSEQWNSILNEGFNFVNVARSLLSQLSVLCFN